MLPRHDTRENNWQFCVTTPIVKIYCNASRMVKVEQQVYRVFSGGKYQAIVARRVLYDHFAYGERS